VIILANENTALKKPNVAYYASRIGDSGYGNNPMAFITNATDEIMARNFPGFALPLLTPYDYNHDALVNATDQILARDNTGFLRAITVPIECPWEF
jgi:hypothetical protein